VFLPVAGLNHHPPYLCLLNSGTMAGFFFFFFFNTGFHSIIGWPQICDSLAPASYVMGLQVYTKTSNLFVELGSHYLFDLAGLKL
jgi:hypothetical protein